MMDGMAPAGAAADDIDDDIDRTSKARNRYDFINRHPQLLLD